MKAEASVLSLLLGLAGCGSPPPAAPRGFVVPDEGRIVDLTRAASAGDPGTTIAVAQSVLQLAPSRCLAPLYVVDLRDRATLAPEFTFTADDLDEYEARHGAIESGSCVVFATGGVRRTRGTREQPARDVGPAISAGVIGLLARQRGAVGFGTDGVGIDPIGGAGSPALEAALSAGAFVLTRLAPLSEVADGRALLFMAPPLVREASAPVRVLALVARTVGRQSR